MYVNKNNEISMILFKNDWNRYPNAIIDTDTRNKSFVRLATLYKDMGVRNHAAILALHNPSLRGIDPYDPTLSTEQMLLIAAECKVNPWYYFREIARDPKGSADVILPFRANRGNIALYWLFFNHITTMLIQIRQTGKSFSIDTLDSYLLNIATNNTDIALLTKDDDIRSKNLIRLKSICDSLPFYLKRRTRHDVGNTEQLTVKGLKNSYTGYVPSSSPKDAELKGRGITSPVMRSDETAFFKNISITLPAALSACTAAVDIAKLKNLPYGITITTTAGKKDDRDGAYVYKLLQESTVWTEKLFDCENPDELESIIRKNSSTGENKRGTLRVNCTFNHRQLGYTDKWLMEAIERSINEGDSAERDYLNRWTSGSLTSPIPIDLMEVIRDSEVSDPYNEITMYGYIVRWYIPEDQILQVLSKHHHILCLDTSDASGGDDIGMVLINSVTGEVTASGNYNETNLIMFAEWLCIWLVKYSNITLIIERRSSGATIIDYMLIQLPTKGINPFKRMYNKVIQDYDEYPDRYNLVAKSHASVKNEHLVEFKKTFGFATSAFGATARSELYGSVLQNSVKMCGALIRDKKLIDQLLGLVVRNNRVDHDVGEKDDLCIAWLLGFWFLTRGKNLSFYGIKSDIVLSKNDYYVIDNNPVSVYDREQLEYVKEQINYLTEDLKKCKDEYIALAIEREIKGLYSELKDDKQTIRTVDELINSIKKQRAINSRNKVYIY